MTRKALVWLCMSCMVVFAPGCGGGDQTQSSADAPDGADVQSGDAVLNEDATPDAAGQGDGTQDPVPDVPVPDEDVPPENIPSSASLLVQKSGEGRVQIAGLAEPMECGEGCEQISVEPTGDLVTLEAHAACGWTFDGWSGSCSGLGSQSVLVDTDLHCIATFSPAGAEEILQAAGTGMTFAHSAEEGWHATQLTMEAGAKVWPLTPRALWSMELWGVGLDFHLTVSGDDAQHRTCYVVEPGPEERALELNWLGVTSDEEDSFDVRVLARALSGDPLLRFSASVSPTVDSSKGRGVGRFDLPVVDFQSPPDGDDAELYLAACGGIQFTNPGVSVRTVAEGGASEGGPLEYQYPDVYNMRFSALANTSEEMVVLLSTEDSPERRFEMKRFSAWGTDAQDIRISLGRLPADPNVPRELNIPGESTLSALPCTNSEACWHDAATWFREKVEAEGYLGRPPLEEVLEPMQAPLLLDASVVVGHDLDTQKNVTPNFAGYLDYLESISAWLGLAPSQMMTTWYDWHDNEFDVDLPQHLPPQSGYVSKVAEARNKGFHVLPYTTPSAWAYSLPTYASLDVAKKWGVLRSDGSPLEYEHVPGHVHHAVDFAVPSLGQHFVDGQYDEIFTNHQVNGLYLDFFPRPARCHATDHGHEIGGGGSFVNGVRDYLSLVQAKAIEKTGSSLIVAEALGDYLSDSMALGNCYRTDGAFVPVETDLLGHIPLFDAVFRDRLQMASLGIADMPGAEFYQYVRELDASTVPGAIENLRRTITLEMGWSFSMGHLLVLMHRPIPHATTGNVFLQQDPDFSSLMDLYKDLTTIRARPDVKEIVVKGRLAVPPETFPNTPPNLPNPSWIPNRILPELAKAIPAVFIQAFTNQKGDIAITIFNWTDTVQAVSFLVHPDRYGMATEGEFLSDVWKVTLHTKAGAQLLTADLNTQKEWLAPNYDGVPSSEPLILLYEKTDPDLD